MLCEVAQMGTQKLFGRKRGAIKMSHPVTYEQLLVYELLQTHRELSPKLLEQFVQDHPNERLSCVIIRHLLQIEESVSENDFYTFVRTSSLFEEKTRADILSSEGAYTDYVWMFVKKVPSAHSREIWGELVCVDDVDTNIGFALVSPLSDANGTTRRSLSVPRSDLVVALE